MPAKLKSQVTVDCVRCNPDNFTNIEKFLRNIGCYDISITKLNELEFRFDDKYSEEIVYSAIEGQYIIKFLDRIFVLDPEEFENKFYLCKSMTLSTERSRNGRS